jgi:hypothetical protein
MEQIRKSCLRLKTIKHDKKPSYFNSLFFVVFFGLINIKKLVILASILTLIFFFTLLSNLVFYLQNTKKKNLPCRSKVFKIKYFLLTT